MVAEPGQLSSVMELVPGCGTNLVLFVLLLVGFVVAETHGYGSSDPAHARPGNSCGGTAGSRVVEWSEWDCPMLDEADYIDWTGGGYSCSRDVGQMDWQQEGMAQLELRDESLRGAVKPLSGNVTSAENSMDVVINVQFGSVFVLRPDHVVHGRHRDRIANAPRGGSTRACQLLFQACSPKNDARLI